MQVKVSAIDKTAEQYEALLEHEDYYAAKVANLKPESRRRLEILATRCLLKEMLHSEPIVSYDQYGAPSLTGLGHYVSISHTDGYVAVALADKPVGIDIERRGRRVERVRSKFMQEAEDVLVEGTADPVLAMHLIWSAKEAVFKYLGQKYFDLQNLTCVTSIDFDKKVMAMDVKDLPSALIINFEFTEEYVLCFSILH